MKFLLSVALLGGLVGSACGKDSSTELQTWRQEACACKTAVCAERARQDFWKLVTEFRDDKPSKERARQLNAMVAEGEACLARLHVDIYALPSGADASR